MQRMAPFLLVLLVASCYEERNPYKTIYITSAVSQGAEDSSSQFEGGEADSVTSSVDDRKTSSGAAPTPVVGNEVKNDLQAKLKLICSNPAPLAKFQTELAVICNGENITKTLEDALKTAYKGGQNAPTLVKVKSVDNPQKSESEMIVLAVLDLPKSIKEVFARRPILNAETVIADNTSVTQSILTNIPSNGKDHLGSMEVKFDMRVDVGAITVRNTRILELASYTFNSDQSVILTSNQLKSGDPNNEDDIVANAISFLVSDLTSTKMITVNHQIVANRGRHATADRTFNTIGQGFMKNAYQKLGQ